MLYACDGPWWAKHHAAVLASGFAGELWTQDAGAAQRHGLHRIRGEGRAGLSGKPDAINTGNNSGYQAIGLAHKWGAARVLLLGYDCQHTGGRAHWFGDHPPGLVNARGCEGWLKNYAALAVDAAAEGLEVVNCTRETALTCFPRLTIDEALPL